MTRSIRDRGAQAMYEERVPDRRPRWTEWLDEDAKAEVRRRFDVLASILNELGVELVDKGDPGIKHERSNVPIALQLVPDPGKDRVVRANGDKFEICVVDRKDGAVLGVDTTFTLAEVGIICDRALMGDPEVAKIPMVGRIMAAGFLLLRARMETPS